MLQAGVAQFAILHSIGKQWVPEFITLEYDVENYIKQYQKSELSLRAKTFAKVIQGELLTGKNYLPQVIKKAYELALLTEATVDPKSIPETYWEQAYQLLCHPIENKSYDG
jgi:ribonucleotide reductase beta subunit family protein with ferritin-like domain